MNSSLHSLRRHSAAPEDEYDRASDAPELAGSARADEPAFARLYRRHVAEIYRYCSRRLGSREEAEDATSQIFTKALAAFGTRAFATDDPGSARAWLFTIAHNVVIDATRAHRAGPLPEEPSTLLDRAPPLEDQAIAHEDLRRLRTLLAELSPDQRQVVELRLSGLTGQEIAAVLGRGRGAIDALQFRAVARLRELFAEPDPFPPKEPTNATQ